MTNIKTIFVNPANVTRNWYIIDASNKIMGKVAVEVAKLVQGKHKRFFTPHQEIGDYVIVINANKIKLTGNKQKDKKYYRHSGYPGSLKVESFNQLNKRLPSYPLGAAIKKMLPKNKMGNKIFTNVKIYAEDTHPHVAQKPIVYEVKD